MQNIRPLTQRPAPQKPPLMQRRHFELIARILLKLGNSSNANLATDQHIRLSEEFADILDLTNPNFDRDRFLNACGVG